MQHQLKLKEDEIPHVNAMAKDKVITLINRNIFHLLKSILDRSEEVYRSFLILFEGVTHLENALKELKELYQDWRPLGPNIHNLGVAAQYRP